MMYTATELETGLQGCDITLKICPSKPQGCPKEPPAPYGVGDFGVQVRAQPRWGAERSVRSDIGIISFPRMFHPTVSTPCTLAMPISPFALRTQIKYHTKRFTRPGYSHKN